MKKFFIYIFLVLSFSSSGFTKETTFKKELFDKAQAEGKVVIVSSWIKYCTSCASQMKVLDKAKNDFDNIEYFAFDVTNKEIAELKNKNSIIIHSLRIQIHDLEKNHFQHSNHLLTYIYIYI